MLVVRDNDIFQNAVGIQLTDIGYVQSANINSSTLA
jgi:hypothetical protein